MRRAAGCRATSGALITRARKSSAAKPRCAGREILWWTTRFELFFLQSRVGPGQIAQWRNSCASATPSTRAPLQIHRARAGRTRELPQDKVSMQGISNGQAEPGLLPLFAAAESGIRVPSAKMASSSPGPVGAIGRPPHPGAASRSILPSCRSVPRFSLPALGRFPRGR